MPKGKPLDLVGKRFGAWTVLEKLKPGKSGQSEWKCKCDCGTVSRIPTGNLRSGASKGCMECGRKKSRESCTTHGESRTPLWAKWVSRIKMDCVPEWLDYLTFKRDVMPKTARCLMKIDESEPFGPDNFIWTDVVNERLFESVDGETASRTAWSRRLGITKERVRQLVSSYGTLEEALVARAEAANVSVKKIIESYSEFDFNRLMSKGPNRGRPSKYPWEGWANGEIQCVCEGGVYDDLEAVRSAVIVKARELEKDYWTRLIPDEPQVLVFRIFNKGGSRG